MPDPSTPWHPEAFAAISMSALERAFWLDQACHAVAYMIIHSNPPGLTEEQLAQRKAILTIAVRLLEAERNMQMDQAAKNWIDYRNA